MKASIIHACIFLVYMLYFSTRVKSNGAVHAREKLAKLSSTFNTHHSGHQSKPRFISFDSDDGKIDINWEVSVPFISIPFGDKGDAENGNIFTLFNINTKALTIAGLVTAIVAFIIPILMKSPPGLHYRSDDYSDWSQLGQTFNDVIFSNSNVAPCIQQIICTVVSLASHTENPTSTDKIIDGLSSNKWFNQMINGTLIEDAVLTGRGRNCNCSYVYKSCCISSTLLNSIITQSGVL